MYPFLTQGCCEVLETLSFHHSWSHISGIEKLVQLTKGIGLTHLEVRCFYSSRRDDIPSAAVAPPLLTLALGLTEKSFFARNVL